MSEFREIKDSVSRQIKRAVLGERPSIPQFDGNPCRDCGNFTLMRAGTCLTCVTCGSTTGCS